MLYYMKPVRPYSVLTLLILKKKRKEIKPRLGISNVETLTHTLGQLITTHQYIDISELEC